MSRKKIKADNVEQLLDIVRAIQNGEEPDEALRRKEMEGAPEADSPNPYSEEEESPKSSEKKKAKSRSEKSKGKQEKDSRRPGGEDFEDDFQEDEFDRILDEDEELNLRPALDRISAGAGKALGALRGLGGKLKAGSSAGKKQKDDIEAAGDTGDAKHEEEAEEFKATAGDKSRSETEEDEFDRLLGDIRDDLEDDLGAESGEGVLDKLLSASTDDRTEENPQQSETVEDLKVPEREEELQEKRSIEKLSTGKTSAEKRSAGKLNIGKLSVKKPKTSETKNKEKNGEREPGLTDSAKGFFSNLKETLEAKGIRQREILMLGMGAVLVVLIIVLVAGGLSASHEEKVKSENVTADEGLTVTVEQQPEQWCSSYPVVLRFRARGQSVDKVTINGEDYVPDENDHIVVVASDYLLEAAATTEQGTLNARIEIPMIDAQPPAVNVSREKEKITVTAADARSTVTKIYYAAVHDGDYLQIPRYQLYSEPLTFQSDTTYYFYAEDKAGNRSNPIVTTTETADEMTLDKEELSLFPEETAYLTVGAVPANALLNNLKYESGNEKVVTVTGSGEVTAVGQGSTVIKISADGVSDVSCPVLVSEERTVTISAIGDCTLGTDASFNTDTNFDAFDAVNGHGYFFQNVEAVLENDDATFANLEGPLTTSDTKTTVEQYAFKGDPAYTEVLKNGSVDVVTLANNHINDYGAQGLEDTKSALEEAGIDYCIEDEIAMKDVNGIPTAFIGIYELNDGIQCESRVQETISRAKNRGAQLVIVAFHWGSERSNQPDETQQSLAHTAIDSGADLVVGHHPHVLQGIEKYNGKYIVYSLGNFCFGGNSAPSDMDTIIFRQTFSVARSGVRTDDNIEIIPCSISSADGYNNYQPTPASGTEAERILGRLNEYSSSFGQTFTASDGLGSQNTQAQEADTEQESEA